MLWLTWRQHRAQVLITSALLGAAGVFLCVHGLGTASAAAGLSAAEPDQVLSGRFRPVSQVLRWLPEVPMLVGLFWGAPLLAREFERGTHRLAWTQSLPRRTWFATKLGALDLAGLVAGTALGIMISTWLSTFEDSRYADRLGDAAMFGSTGVAGGAWWLFAFVLGACAGALLRRLLPAMVVTLAVLWLAVMGLPSRAITTPCRIGWSAISGSPSWQVPWPPARAGSHRMARR